MFYFSEIRIYFWFTADNIFNGTQIKSHEPFKGCIGVAHQWDVT